MLGLDQPHEINTTIECQTGINKNQWFAWCASVDVSSSNAPPWNHFYLLHAKVNRAQ